MVGALASMTADMPNAPITSVTITGSSVSASITLGIANAVVYKIGAT